MILSDSQMLKTGYLAQTFHLYWRLFQNSQVSLNPHNISHVGFMSMPTSSKFQNMITRHNHSGYSCHSTMASETEASVVNPCTANTNKSSCPRRSYQVVVAATRDMGIGKDGKLPWNLPSDLKFFKEVTTSTSVAGKRNAVIMGRRTWESIPPKYRPLPGRLNVVLTRSGKLEGTTLEDLLVCCDLSSALKLLAKFPYSFSVEKVFIIGGGQVLKEALNAPGCEAIHLTDIETNIECDTFIPRINLSLFHQSCSSEPVVENNIRFSFVTYVRTRLSAD